MSSKGRRSLAKLTAQVRAACGPIPQVSDPGAASVSTEMVDLYRQFLTQPTADRYRAAIFALANESSDLAPALLALEQAHRERRFKTVQTLVRKWTKYFALSPRFHRLAAIAALELNDHEDAELERFAADACLEGILSSGDGSDARPFLIMDAADAQEVLAKLGLKSLRQSLMQNNGSLCDVFEVRISAKSIREIWFSTARPPATQAEPVRSKTTTAKSRSSKIRV